MDEAGWDTMALMERPPPRPKDSPTELERERLGRGDGAVKRDRQKERRKFKPFMEIPRI